jgi:hypothetical protein
LARLVLLDAAHLQEEDARYRARIAARRGSAGQLIAPLYSIPDALHSFDHFGRTAVYDEPIELAAARRRGSRYFSDACYALDNFERSLSSTDGRRIFMGKRRSSHGRCGPMIVFSSRVRNTSQPLQAGLGEVLDVSWVESTVYQLTAERLILAVGDQGPVAKPTVLVG